MKNRMVSILLTAVLALSAGLIGCGGEGVPEITEYNLTISSTEGGEVTTPGEGPHTYEPGMVIDLVAESQEGYRFVGWTGDVDDIADVEDATTAITMNGDCSITANFEAIAPVRYSLTVSSTAGGSVTMPGKGTFSYGAGAVVNLAAAPDPGYRFVNWTGSVGTVANVIAATTTVTINADYSIMANFEVEVDFPDPDFEAAIRGPIDESTGSIFPSDLQGHTFFA